MAGLCDTQQVWTAGICQRCPFLQGPMLHAKLFMRKTL